jgi:putative phosphoribosyl transferase
MTSGDRFEEGCAVRFRDRDEAGRALGSALLGRWSGNELLVLGLPRGGIPVAARVAQALHAPLDVLVVRKLGTPGHPELAMGAIASGGIQVLNDGIVRQLRISRQTVEAVAARELVELERRERVYRGDRPRTPVRGRTVLLVDDGLATGATMRAAVEAVRAAGAAIVVVAVPVGAPDSIASLPADEVVCLHAPRSFGAVGSYYRTFTQTTDDEVRRVLSGHET